MPKKVLIAEDTPDILDALRLLMEMRGYEVITATGGLDALRAAEEHQPDLILLDLMMPDLGGEQALLELRARPAFARTPILCVSSYTEGRRAELLDLGFTDVFSKTSFIRSFASTLEKHLGG